MQATTTITAVLLLLFAIGNCTLVAQDNDVAAYELARRVPDISVRIVSRISMADKPEMRVSENGFDKLVPLP